MNASRLREILELLVANETEFAIQQRLVRLQTNYTNLTNQPQNTEVQLEFVGSKTILEDGIRELYHRLNPSQVSNICDIGAERFFSPSFVQEINNWVQEYSATPIVAIQKINGFLMERQSFLDRISQTLQGLDIFGVSVHGLQKGESEIGFLIPRSIFQNTLEKMIKELNNIQFIIKLFSEATIGSVAPIEVRQISTSDPIFFLNVAWEIIHALGETMIWGAGVLGAFEKFKKAKTALTETDGFSQNEIDDILDNKIETQKRAAIEAQRNKILANRKFEEGRRNELENGLDQALELILARIEMGMKVEIRFLPPAVDNENEQVLQDQSGISKLEDIVARLEFPKVDGAPVMRLGSSNTTTQKE